MKKVLRILTGAAVAAALAAGAIAVSVPTEAARPDSGRKQVQLACKPGWRGSVGGQYGGVSFTLGCENGRASMNLNGTVGTAYTARMGVESETAAYDCFFSGDAAVVQESCADVRFSIR